MASFLNALQIFNISTKINVTRFNTVVSKTLRLQAAFFATTPVPPSFVQNMITLDGIAPGAELNPHFQVL